MKEYYSHKDKPLRKHLEQVRAKTKNRTHLKIAEIAALFHDLGKINPNFQRKLNGEKVSGYSNHASLSALSWLLFFEKNKPLAKEILDGDGTLKYSVATIIAKHHGNLPNFVNGFLGCEERDKLKKFISDIVSEDLEISNYLSDFFPHNYFTNKIDLANLDNLLGEIEDSQESYLRSFTKQILPKIQHKQNTLDYFLNTQFAFACLIESDKRDAAENEEFNKTKLSENLISIFSNNLQQKFLNIAKKSAEEKNDKKIKLDSVRSEMREMAVGNLRLFLKDDTQRVFTLSAPTGAGKTLMLLNLAKEILASRKDLSVIYALPFLAITEQTEKICRDIFKNDELVLRVDSKSENKKFQELQQKLDDNPSDEKVKELLQEMFSAETFDHPFIITTFVQVFETLVSNRNSTLLRLPNFSKTIFLLDEIQALPPSLYTFFVAYLDEFCRKFDSYAIVSTATMPDLRLPDESNYKEIEKPSKVFRSYCPPSELLSEDFYFREEFNRYCIKPKYKIETIDDLKNEIEQQEKSCLVVLNTIKDTKELFSKVNKDSQDCHYILLNTHFTLEDRQKKLKECQPFLDKGKKVVLISTQLIEAGVDIDFPVVYRDMCPLPNLIQTAGRCNRNNRLEFGEVFLFELKAEKEKKNSSSLIYNKNYDWILNETRKIQQETFENEILPLHKNYAETQIKDALKFGEYQIKEKELNLVECINEIRFEDFGKVKLIDEDYGFQLRYYINPSDGEFEKLERLVADGKKIPKNEFAKVKIHRESVIEPQLKKMANRIVTVRLSENKANEAMRHLGSEPKCCGIFLISSENHYDKFQGLVLSVKGGEII